MTPDGASASGLSRSRVVMDVPSPIDLERPEEALAWAEAANRKRPWRAEFFAAIVDELRTLGPTPSVLELGSGPGFLAEAVLRECPAVRYTLFDSSLAMHHLARARLADFEGVHFVKGDFKAAQWADDVGMFDAVVTVQAVHELRHRAHATGLHRAVGVRLLSQGLYLVCDHVAGPDGMADHELYMTVNEQAEALRGAGFVDVSLVLEKRGLVLHRAHKAAPG